MELVPLDYVGVIFARDAIEMPAKVDGILRTVSVWPGDRVTQGMSLATLESRATEHEFHEAVASAQMAEADRQKADVELQQAREQLRRSQALGSLISPAELDNARGQVVLAQARFDSAVAHTKSLSAQLRLSKRSVQDTVLRAPFDGVVSVRLAEPGTLVRAGTPILRLIRNDELWIRFAVPEERLAEVEIGQTLTGQLPAMGDSFAAVVTSIAPELDGATRAVFVEARLDARTGRAGRLLAGLEARVHPATEIHARMLPAAQAVEAAPPPGQVH